MGEISTPNFFLVLSMSNGSGNFARTSEAILSMYSSLLMPDPASPERQYQIGYYNRDTEIKENSEEALDFFFLLLFQNKSILTCLWLQLH